MKTILKSLATVTIISTITRLIAFVFKIYLSRALGAEVLGVYQITMSIFVLLMALPASGIPTALSRHIAEARATGANDRERGIISSALLLASGVSIVIIAIFYLFPHVTSLLFHDKRCVDMFYILLPALFSTSIYAIIRGYLWGSRDFLSYSMAEFFEEIMSILVIVITLSLGLFGRHLTRQVAFAYLISDYVATAILIVIFFVKGGRLSRPNSMRALTASAVPMTSMRLLGSFMSSMMALLIPLLLARHGLSTAEATASYGRASGMAMPLIFVPSTIVGGLATVVIPELASSRVKGESIEKHISSGINFALLISCLFVAIFISSGDRLTHFLYKDEIAGTYMILASFIMIPMSINQMTVSVLNTLGHESDTLKCHLIGSSILLVLIFVLPRYIGIYSYFVGVLTFHVITSMIYLHRLGRYVHVDRSMLKPSIIIIVFSTLLGLGLRLLSRIISHDFVAVLICSFVIAIAYSLFATKLGYIDIKIIREKMTKKVSK